MKAAIWAILCATAFAGPAAWGEPRPAPPRFPEAGRPVAAIVGSDWGEARQRDAAREVPQLIARLGLKPGMTVGDMGAGTGYDTVRLARMLGPKGRVVAEDVEPEYLMALSTEATRQKLDNVVIALGEPQDPRLPARSLDAAILVHMYHEITHPYAFLYNLAPALKPGAKVGVEELDRPTSAHGTPPALLRCEFEAVGYRQLSMAPLKGGLGYLAVFAAPTQLPEPQRIRACRA
ncbi:methyltransferase domain-containing protein [Caulobacter sp. S45]|uniref:methyltransferase domain-containing protein n=1 Tax=Caulobacter sp. S45 TaxID=1641861 RepID=UPI001C20488B|nr:methyltransferase domain-containing protein [Caulobacter sp. S45]